MQLTKYEHACCTLEKDNQLLVVDPGNFTTDFIAPEGVVAVVVTHQHADHFDQEQLAAIAAKNPAVVVVAHPSITEQLETIEKLPVLPGDQVELGPFSLHFFGGQHAVIHADLPPVANLGVLINDLLYYPGDSFVRPDVPVDTLALPVSAPWLSIAEVVDFVRDVAPRFAFPTHDAILSGAGKSLPDRMIPELAPAVTYRRIDGETIAL